MLRVNIFDQRRSKHDLNFVYILRFRFCIYRVQPLILLFCMRPPSSVNCYFKQLNARCNTKDFSLGKTAILIRTMLLDFSFV